MLDSVRLETKCDLTTEFKRARETQKSAPVVPGFMGGTAQCRGTCKNYAYWLFGADPNRLMEELGMPDYLPTTLR
jgi:hypothetical protein